MLNAFCSGSWVVTSTQRKKHTSTRKSYGFFSQGLYALRHLLRPLRSEEGIATCVLLRREGDGREAVGWAVDLITFTLCRCQVCSTDKNCNRVAPPSHPQRIQRQPMAWLPLQISRPCTVVSLKH